MHSCGHDIHPRRWVDARRWLLGTVLCLDPGVHRRLPGWIEDTVQALCRGHGREARVHYRRIAPRAQLGIPEKNNQPGSLI
jgi:metal-dependent amidase/aminoacylase/carboxypeptidase family protein